MLNDKRCCPNCGHEQDKQPYLMARRAPENVLSLREIAWVVAAVLLVALWFAHAS